MFRLDLLGRTDLRDAEGTELLAVLAQPKRFALFVYLALGTPTGAVRRDTLLAIFWPELDQDHARKALNKAIHFLRQHLGNEVIQSRGAEELALNTASVRCDAVELIAATARGDDFAAAELYRGDLLPAFYVSDAPEFERWLDEQRTKLRRVIARACHVVAERLQHEGNGTAAVAFARRAVDLSHDDERPVQRLLELLAQLGDRAGALYAYEEFARRLASEVDAEPSKETRELVERIRLQHKTEGGSRERASPSPRADDFHSEARVAMPPVSESEAPTPQTAVRPSSHGVPRRRRAVVALAIVLVGSVAAWAWSRGRVFAKADRVALGAPNDSSAPKWALVADFESPPDDPNLGVVVRELVTGVLDESRMFETVGGDQLAEARRNAMIPDTARLTPERARHLAMRTAVGIVIDGRVDQVRTSYDIVVHATAVIGGATLASATEVATDATILEVTRRLAKQLRDSLVGRDAAWFEPVAGAATPSLDAFRKYVAAVMPDTMNSERGAALLREAVTIDSGFAAAWTALGSALRQLGDRDSASVAYLAARRTAERLTRRERMMLEASIARDIRLDSDSAVLWLDRLIKEDRTFGPAYELRALALRDLARYGEAIESCERAIELSPLGPQMSVIDTCVETMAPVGRTLEARKLGRRLEGTYKWDLDATVAVAENDWDRLDMIAWAQLSGHRGEGCCWRAYTLLASAQAARGQLAAAKESLKQAKLVFPYPGAVSLLELLLAVASDGTPDRYDLPQGFRDAVPTPRGTGMNPTTWNMMLFPMWAAWRGDTGRAEREYRAFSLDTNRKTRVEVSMPRAWIDSREGRWERVPELLAADAWIGINGGGWWGSLNLRRWLVAEAYERMGRLDSAAAFFKTITNPTNSNWGQADSRGLVHSFALRRLALLEDKLGQADSARVHWEQFMDTFTRPDSAFRHLVDEARRKARSGLVGSRKSS